jgi:predicted nucleic acid-binding protein
MAALPSARGNFLHDVRYAVLLREHGVRRICTADSDFKKFDFLDVMDPTVE